MRDAPTAELPEPLHRQHVAVERRRPGRLDYQHPALIRLLRNPAGDAALPDHDDVANDRGAYPKPAQPDERHFTLTNFDRLHPRLGDPRGALRHTDASAAPSIEIDVARAERYCRDDRYSSEWSELVAAEVGKIKGFITGSDYPRDTPTDASINALTTTLVAISGFARHLCLICGRDGTPQANRVVAEAIRSLGCRTQVPGEYSYWSELRALCASLCFYWAVAGAIARHDFTTARSVMHTRTTRNGSEEALVSALPLLALGSIEWKVLKGFEERRTPASDFLFNLFRTELADAAFDPGEAPEYLFDRLEFLVSLEFSHLRLQQIAASSRPMWFWTPLGRYVANLGTQGVLDRLAALEELRADHAFLQAGLLGGTPASAARVAQAMRQILEPEHRRAGY
jgi:hypothetical protein